MRFAVFVLICASVCAACGGDTPSSPSSTSTDRATERFDDIINRGESKFHAFSVGSNGTTSINLASLSPVTGPGAITATMEIGWGKTIKAEDGTVVGCDLAKVMQVTPAFTSQMNDTLTPSADYCANIADVGGLRESANFAIRITHP
jgi:hypothetical protein